MRVTWTFTRFLRKCHIVTIATIVVIFYTLKNRYENVSSLSTKKPKLITYVHRQDYFIPRSFKKKDWHNYTQIKYEIQRVGLGENGQLALLPKGMEQLEKDVYMKNGFNGALSDKIALDRSVPDIRHPVCKHRQYLESLPSVSVIVPFYNEHYSTLLRTVVSVLNRTPEHLIKEFFLVDDGSTRAELKGNLEQFLAQHAPKVKLLRLKKRGGVVAGRLAGAKAATADVLLILDSHSEVNVNWLPPLLEPIALDYRTVVCPFIDVIDYDTFEYRAQDEGARGAFDYELYYKRIPLLPQQEEKMPEPFESPVMAGGLFAMSRVFFWELGGYDPGLEIWGGEQFELSFKIWQCGGRILDAPCSRVGHNGRRFSPFLPMPNDFMEKNNRRVADVWMDEYADYLYPGSRQWRSINPGDLTEQKALREKLKCKPFKWFMTQIAFDLDDRYPLKMPKPFAKGRIRPLLNQEMCVDGHHGKPGERFTLTLCREHSHEQIFNLSWFFDIVLSRHSGSWKPIEMCWDTSDSTRHGSVAIADCHRGGGNQKWRYHQHNKTLVHSSGVCLDHHPVTFDLFVDPCDKNSITQQWTIDTVNTDQMDKWNDKRTCITAPIEEWKES